MRELTQEEQEFQERLSALTANGPKMSFEKAKELANLFAEAPSSLRELAPGAPTPEELGIILQKEITKQE